jgi:FkbM family methyltransferase
MGAGLEGIPRAADAGAVLTFEISEQVMTPADSALLSLLRNIRDAMRIGWRFPLRHLAAAIGRKRFSTQIRGFGRITIRTKSSDALVVRQVFGARDYDISGFGQFEKIQRTYDDLCRSDLVPIIIDAGANIGASAIWFASQFPKAKILAVEPDAANAACCRANVGNFANIDVVEAAIGSSPGFVSLKNETGEAWAVQTERIAEKEGIRICTVAELLRAFTRGRLFIIKIDIEGFEADLFESNTAWLAEPAAVLIEPHDWMLPGKGSSLSLQKAMARHDFEMLLKGENLIYVRM